ncbi:hypothetical protein [Niabella drilacis]|uniref:Uncharacterized protein n=1 Tax=Niabella drilacis (strain DSM 25811 / CCM 8410 / CCUG 62505 / LMG 26954 / E90) TaxID=1285928 RepID=A0A1G6S877_NIADE|nr:hypothetical protein [Niabella drilacis]SDD12871.1 hypothetical protein SAMN04487894_106127 [Niabella drilacis]
MKTTMFTKRRILPVAPPFFWGGCIKTAKELAAAAPYRSLPVVLFDGGHEGGGHSSRTVSVVKAGRGDYSSMTRTADDGVAAWTEFNENLHVSTSNKSIALHKFSLSRILENNPE